MDTEFEKRIAYCFDVENPNAVLEYFIPALEMLNQDETLPSMSKGAALEKLDKDGTKGVILEYLEKAYNEVKTQNGWDFDVKSAVQHEYQLIVSHTVGDTHENLVRHMMNQYSSIFNGHQPDEFRQISELRTFVYNYKNLNPLTAEDKTMLIGMADLSKQKLRFFYEHK